jgi:hypothetical protein
MSPLLFLAYRLGEAELIIPGTGPAPSYRPFVTPLPIWDWWILTLIPLCLGVAIVYKALKCGSMREVPKQALMISLWIIGGMGAAALLLALIVKIL